MRLENTFEVPVPADRAWDLLMDVPRVIPCMPGAELLETLDDSHWKAKLTVKLGPIGLVFGTDVAREEADEAARSVTLKADARELRGRGSARATIESSLTSANGLTRVEIVTDVALSGPVAQYGRGMIADVSDQLVTSFASCLQAQLEASPEAAEAAVRTQAKPVSGLRLGFRALGRRLARLFGRGGSASGKED